MIITLGSDDLIGSGGRQYVFDHPYNSYELIKVSREIPAIDTNMIFTRAKFVLMPYKRRQWIRDAYDSYRQYMNILAITDKCPSYIAGHRGFVQTSFGVGCVYEKVCDEPEKNQISLTVDKIVRSGGYKKDELTSVIDVFFDDIYDDKVYISDLSLDNLCVVRNASGYYERIVLIDGLGRKTLVPLSINRRVYSRWHQSKKIEILSRMERLRRSTRESM